MTEHYQATTAAELAARPRPAPVTRYYADSQEVGLVHETGHEYCVPLDRCDTPEKLLGWLRHLSEKNWITPKHLRELLDHAHVRRGVAVDHGC